MACPFFKPLRLAEWDFGRAPLGGVFEGECEQQGEGSKRLCNFGYARGICPSFPASAAADAVRFSVAGTENGAVRVVWILEKDHVPAEHGIFEFRKASGQFLNVPQGAMAAQAAAFIENYLRRLA